jgi:hypothetical protein
MNHIEDDLKAALRRKPAPPGFAAKVMERIENGSFNQNVPRSFLRNPFWMAAAAAVVLVAIGAGIFGYQSHIRARNEAALHRTLAALSIAAAQLDQAEKKAFEPERWERIGRQLAGIQSSDKR